MHLDPAVCHAAVEARDRRYDGLFFTGVSSTGIYCRCVCPARVPKRENRSFHPSAAAAEREGYRPCLLCRPECAPGAAPIDATERLAHDAVKRIESGALEDGGIEALASDLGVTGRHLRRAVLDTFGAAPVEIAQTHRLLTAKRLLRDTSLSMAQVAFAAGFQSVRRFNALFQARYAMPPSRVRDRASSKQTSLTFTLAPRGTFDGAAPFAHFTLRGVARMERAAAPLVWSRTFAADGHAGHLTLDLSGEAPQLTLSEGLVPAFRAVVAALRGALDLDANLDAINAFLAREGFAEEVRRDPAVRLPGALDPFELAVRAVIGQQVTVKAATTIVARLVERFGAPIETGVAGLDRLFPTPSRLADATEAELASMGQPAARTATVQRLARAVAEGKLRLARGAVAVGRAGLAEIAGIGPWTLEYVAMRGLGDPDAFPLGDSALRAAFEGDLKRANESWRPWRAYAAARLWRRPASPRKKAV
jgi:AraC family transcriptional regulator of adaptative response / DNA-3-methyladenine glycosylase II